MAFQNAILICLMVFLYAILQVQSRESKFFSKFTHNNKVKVSSVSFPPIESPSLAPEPIPTAQEPGYGLFGGGSGTFVPSKESLDEVRSSTNENDVENALSTKGEKETFESGTMTNDENMNGHNNIDHYNDKSFNAKTKKDFVEDNKINGYANDENIDAANNAYDTYFNDKSSYGDSNKGYAIDNDGYLYDKNVYDANKAYDRYFNHNQSYANDNKDFVEDNKNVANANKGYDNNGYVNDNTNNGYANDNTNNVYANTNNVYANTNKGYDNDNTNNGYDNTNKGYANDNTNKGYANDNKDFAANNAYDTYFNGKNSYGDDNKGYINDHDGFLDDKNVYDAKKAYDKYFNLNNGYANANKDYVNDNQGYNTNLYDGNYNNDEFDIENKGMSDTRDLENGKYFYDLKKVKNDPNEYLNGREWSSSGTNTKKSNEINTMEDYNQEIYEP